MHRGRRHSEGLMLQRIFVLAMPLGSKESRGHDQAFKLQGIPTLSPFGRTFTLVECRPHSLL